MGTLSKATYLRVLIERAVRTGLELDCVEVEGVEPTIGVVEVADGTGGACQNTEKGCKLEHFGCVCVCEIDLSD